MSSVVNYLFSDLASQLPLELLAVIYLCYGVVVVKAIVDIFLLLVRRVCNVR